jgi:acyl-coenzyme A thioesterase PaaI-like protein
MGFAYELLFARALPLLDLLAPYVGKFGKKNHAAESRASYPPLADVIGPLPASPVPGEPRAKRASCRVGREMRNPMGGLHGGCQSVMAEAVAAKAVGAAAGGREARLRAMSVAYASAGRGELEITARIREEREGAVTSVVRLDRKGGGAMCAEATLTYDLL